MHNIIWIHGFGEDEKVWDNFLPLINKKCNSYVFTHYWRIGHNSIQAYAADLKSFIDLNKIDDPIIIGHSMGGYIAVEFAAQYKNHVKALGFFHSSAAADSETKKKEREKTKIFLLKHGVPAFMKGFYPNMFGEKFKQNNYKFVESNIVRYSSFETESMISATESMKNRLDHVGTLETFDFPIFQILGKNDPFVPLEKALEQTMKMKRPNLLLIEDIGHCGMVESPEICAEFINDFLDRM